MGLPMIILYWVSPSTWCAVNLLETTGLIDGKTVGLPNLLTGRPVADEFIQSDILPSRIADTAWALLHDPQRPTGNGGAYSVLHRELGSKGATERAARAILAHLGHQRAESQTAAPQRHNRVEPLPGDAQDKSATLVLLSYNERDNLAHLLERIPFDLFSRVLAVDPGSTDGTLELYRDRGIPCAIQPKYGRGNAFILAERLLDTEYVVFFSTDGNEDPEDLPRVLTHLMEGNDLVIAGRYLLPGARTDDSDDPFLLRKTAGILGGAIVRSLWRTQVRDCINGFRGFRVASLRRLQLDAEWHEIELQSTIRAAKLGMRIKEFGTIEQPRITGAHKKSANTITLLLSLGRALAREIVVGRRFVPEQARGGGRHDNLSRQA